MKKKTKVLLLLSCALVLVVGAVAAVALRQQPAAPPGPEPTPRKIGAPGTVMIKVMQGVGAVNRSCGLPLGLAWVEAPERTSTEGVSLSFTGLDVDETEGTVTLNLLLENEQEVHNILPMDLDYRSEGRWYTVYSVERRNALSGAVIPGMGHVYEPGSTPLTLEVPKEAFKNRGQYRMVLGPTAYCTFEVTPDGFQFKGKELT